PPLWRRRDREVLCARVEGAVERRNVDIRALDARPQNLGDAPDFAYARQEDEDRAALAVERIERDARDFVLDAGAWLAADIAHRDRIGAAFAFNEWRIVKQRAHPRAVERRRHDEEPQVLAQG